MTALYNIKRLWPRAATILPPRQIHDSGIEKQAAPITDPVAPSTTDEGNQREYDGSDLTPVNFRRMNTFNARQNIIMAAAQHVPAKIILDSGACISGVVEQWKLIDISRMSFMSII